MQLYPAMCSLNLITGIFRLVIENLEYKVCFSHWLRDSQLRKYEVSLAYKIGEMSRFKGVVMSSGCLNRSEIRSPSDASCLIGLARFPENVIPSLTKNNGTIAIIHAFNRQTGKCAIILKRKNTSNNEEELSEKKTKQ